MIMRGLFVLMGFVAAVAMDFFFLSTFCWMTIMSFDIFLTFR